MLRRCRGCVSFSQWSAHRDARGDALSYLTLVLEVGSVHIEDELQREANDLFDLTRTRRSSRIDGVASHDSVNQRSSVAGFAIPRTWSVGSLRTFLTRKQDCRGTIDREQS